MNRRTEEMLLGFFEAGFNDGLEKEAISAGSAAKGIKKLLGKQKVLAKAGKSLDPAEAKRLSDLQKFVKEGDKVTKTVGKGKKAKQVTETVRVVDKRAANKIAKGQGTVRGTEYAGKAKGSIKQGTSKDVRAVTSNKNAAAQRLQGTSAATHGTAQSVAGRQYAAGVHGGQQQAFRQSAGMGSRTTGARHVNDAAYRANLRGRGLGQSRAIPGAPQATQAPPGQFLRQQARQTMATNPAMMGTRAPHQMGARNTFRGGPASAYGNAGAPLGQRIQAGWNAFRAGAPRHGTPGMGGWPRAAGQGFRRTVNQPGFLPAAGIGAAAAGGTLLAGSALSN